MIGRNCVPAAPDGAIASESADVPPLFTMPSVPSHDSGRKTARRSVPAEDGEVLASPSLPDAAHVALANQRRLDASDVNVQGRTLTELRRWSRGECLHAAARYTSTLGTEGTSVPEATGPLVIAGHQPALFHPGVWVKNFAIAGLADTTDGIGLNLVVDNDTLNQTGIRVPGGTPDAPGYETVLFDAPRRPQPWEDAVCADRALFSTFADRAGEHMRRWNVDPILPDAWPDAVHSLEASPRLCDALTSARHAQEVRWGTVNLELPVSRMCETESFLWFASHLLAHLPRFHDIHNRVLSEYRAANRVRSRSHPVPALGEDGGRLEAPFWVWRRGERLRRPVFVRQDGRQLQLSDSQNVVATLKLAPDMDACCAVEELRRLPAAGIRFRTRALTTTLFSRIALGDLFVHGIGGAKYDELTDRIISEFFGLTPPPFLTLSATLRLPLTSTLPPPPATAEIRRELRDLRFNADRHQLDTDIRDLAEEKQALVAAQQAARPSGLSSAARRARRDDNRLRYQRLKDVNARLFARADARRRTLESALLQAVRDDATRRVLLDRDYAWCLHPADRLHTLAKSLAFVESRHGQ